MKATPTKTAKDLRDWKKNSQIAFEFKRSMKVKLI